YVPAAMSDARVFDKQFESNYEAIKDFDGDSRTELALDVVDNLLKTDLCPRRQLVADAHPFFFGVARRDRSRARAFWMTSAPSRSSPRSACANPSSRAARRCASC